MKVLFWLAPLLMLHPLCAQDSLQRFELHEVVVTGEIEPQSLRKSVYQVKSIPLERIRSQGATKLQDVLATELNVRFSQDNALGGSNITMRGLPGQNVKILIDGVPVIGRQGVGNEVNINQINVNTIERIEIIEGPMAVIYGADALAGVINIITRKTNDKKLEVTATIHEESAGSEYGWGKGVHNHHVNLFYQPGAFYFTGNITRNDFGGWTGDSTGREKAWHPKTQWLSSGLIGYKKNSLNTYYRLDYLHEKIHNPGRFIGNEAIDQNYLTDRLMQQWQLNGTFSKKWSYHAALSHTFFERETQTVAVNRATGRETLANNELQSANQFNGLTLRGGLQYKLSDHLTFLAGYDINHEKGTGSRLKKSASAITDYAVYFSGDIMLTKAFSIRPGLRFINNSVYDAPPVVSSLNAKFAFSESHVLRASYGRGFRAPSIRELYFDFFDASHAIEGNQNLRAELSHTIDVSWEAVWLKNTSTSFKSSLSAYYSTVEDMINYGIVNGNVTTYVNVSRYRSKGIVLANSISHNGLTVGAGVGITGRYNQLRESDVTLPEFTWSPEVNGSASYEMEKAAMTVSLFYKYTGKTPDYVIDPATGKSTLAILQDYHWADFSVHKQVKNKLGLSAGLRNIFDVTRIFNSVPQSGSAHSGSGSGRPVGYGRSFFLTVSYTFQKD